LTGGARAGRRAARPRLLAVVALGWATTRAAPARAAEGDGAYGRFDGDVELGASAGAALGQGGPAFVAAASAVYLGAAGLYAQYADALGSTAPLTARSIAGGVVMRPVFLGRYASDLERGPARLDLLLDSFALEVGAVWSAPNAAGFGATPGLEIALELAAPLLPRASGPYLALRGALRLRPDDLAGRGEGALGERGALLSLTLGWRQIVATHLVDARDEVAR
jgi:hypothetical protein